MIGVGVGGNWGGALAQIEGKRGRVEPQPHQFLVLNIVLHPVNLVLYLSLAGLWRIGNLKLRELHISVEKHLKELHVYSGKQDKFFINTERINHILNYGAYLFWEH